MDERVALMIYSLGGGGAERATACLAEGLAAVAGNVDVVVARAEGPNLGRIDQARLINLRAANARVWLQRTVGYLRSAQPRRVLAVMEGAGVVALTARGIGRSKARVVVVSQNHLSLHTGRTDRWKERHLLHPAVRRLYPRADGIVAVSEGTADDLAEVARLPRPRIEVIHNPIPPDVAARAAEPPRHPWLNGEGPPTVLAAGRLTEQKDFPTLLRAFQRARGKRPLRLVILGEGPDRGALERLADELGIAADVDLPGFIEDPYPWMAAASVFACSSAWEGFANVLSEALACGTPVVSTDCPSGPAEVLDHGRHGRLVSVGDDAALAEAILNTLQDPPAPERLRSRAEAFSLERAVERYSAVLEL